MLNDCIHIATGLLLAGWILGTQTCRGISGRTQTIVSIANFAKFAYFVGSKTENKSCYKISVTAILAAISGVLMYLIFVKFKKTLEKAYDTFWIEVIIIISGVLAIVNNEDASDPFDVLYAGSYYLESVSVLPQIYFNFRTGSKSVGVSLYVLLCTVYKTLHVRYAMINKTYYAPVSHYPGYIQLGTYALYFILLVAIPKYKEEKLILDLDSHSASLDDLTLDGDNQPSVIIVTRPALERQQSRLEMPFLKKTLPSTSSLTTSSAKGSRSSSKINTPAVQKKLKNVRSNPNFRAEKSDVPFKRTHSASSIASQRRESLVDSLDEGIILEIKETARDGRQRRMTYVRQTSLPEKKSSLAEDDNELNSTIETPLEEAVNECVPNVQDIIEDQEKLQDTLQLNGSIQASILDSTEQISEPNRRRPSCPDAVLQKKRRKQSISTPPDFHRKSRRATMQVGPNSHQQNNWKLLASNFIGMSPSISRPSSPLYQSEVDWPVSFGESASSRFEARKKRRATVQALYTHQSNWKTLASGLIGTSEAPPETKRIASVERINSKSKNLVSLSKRRATVQLTHAMPSLKKRSSWQKLTDGFVKPNPSVQRRVSSPFNYFRDQRNKSKEDKTEGRKQKSSWDQSANVIGEDVESQD